MKQDEFASLVREMRNAQRTYFRERSPQWLSRAREYERRVDRACEEILNKQKVLFEK